MNVYLSLPQGIKSSKGQFVWWNTSKLWRQLFVVVLWPLFPKERSISSLWSQKGDEASKKSNEYLEVNVFVEFRCARFDSNWVSLCLPNTVNGLQINPLGLVLTLDYRFLLAPILCIVGRDVFFGARFDSNFVSFTCINAVYCLQRCIPWSTCAHSGGEKAAHS